MISSHSRLTFTLAALLTVFTFGIQTLTNATALAIVPDGLYDDWGAEPALHTDTSGDQGSDVVDFGSLWVANDDNRLYLRLEVGAEIELQESNSIVCYIDSDNNASTGLSVGGIGAEFSWEFGNRSGSSYFPGGGTAGSDIWFAFGTEQEPTTTATEFEIAFDRSGTVDGVSLFQGSTLAILFQNENGGVQDRIPNTGQTVIYTFDSTPVSPFPTTPLARRHPDHVRIVTHNALNDGLTDPGRNANFQRIYQALQPDIICFQELYTSTAVDVSQEISSFLGGSWYAVKNNDTITVSRWPITNFVAVNGNHLAVIDLPDGTYTEDLALINAHLPCCSNETGRQDEVDAIMEIVRDNIIGGLPAGTPFAITGDMNFVGFRQQLITYLTGDIQDNGSWGADFDPDWDASPLTDAMPLHVTQDEVFTWWNSGSNYAPGRLDFFVYSDSVASIARSFALWTPAMDSGDLSAAGLLANDVPDAADHLPVVIDLVMPGIEVPAVLTQFGQSE